MNTFAKPKMKQINKWNFVSVNICKSQAIITHCCDSFSLVLLLLVLLFFFFFFHSSACPTYGSCHCYKTLIEYLWRFKNQTKNWIILTHTKEIPICNTSCILFHTFRLKQQIYAHIKRWAGQIPLNCYIVYF